MDDESFKGQFIDGSFQTYRKSETFVSMNPSHDDQVVFSAASHLDAIDDAVWSARAAAKSWRGLGLDGRIEALRRVQAKVDAHAAGIAEAISAEMGKVSAEALVEARSIKGKIDSVIRQLPYELPPAFPDAPGEQAFDPMGVVGIIGPFNFPIHLLNTHVIPALITGNTVVAKPSEVTPLCGQRYAALFEDAQFPAGVFNLVHGGGEVGQQLVSHREVDAVIFTGSYHTGRQIREATFDMPWKKVALELGGKNPAVVLDDADLDQAVREILLGAFLTTGQRCTATSRVIATAEIAPRLLERLADAVAVIKPGDPNDAETFMGPLATKASAHRFQSLLASARSHGAQVVVESAASGPGAFVTPGLYVVTGEEPFLREELFGPHLAFEIASDPPDAFGRAANNAYGLSASLFSAEESHFQAFRDTVKAGVFNFNRSTNGASGLLPFGGTGMSGNWRPAGSCGPRLSTYPVALMRVEYGRVTPHPALESLLSSAPQSD